MESQAHLKHARMAPRKLGVVADLVRGKNVSAALSILKFTKRAAAAPLAKLIKSAIANAQDRSSGQVNIDALFVKEVRVNQGPMSKRFMPRAMGRATRITKKTSHVSVVLAEAKSRRSES